MLERARRDATMKILTWNVNGRVDEACSRQLDCVLAVAPDVLALQEVTLASYPAWCAGLVQAGYSVVSSVDLVNLPYPEVQPPISRRYFNLMATRGRIATLPRCSPAKRPHGGGRPASCVLVRGGLARPPAGSSTVP